MSNAIARAIATIKRKIPPEILRFSFQPHYQYLANTPTSIDHEIEHQVLRPRVLMDCDLVGGTEETIRTNRMRIERTPDSYSILYVPKEITSGRTITQALFLSYISAGAGIDSMGIHGFNPCSLTPMSSLAAGLMTTHAPQGVAGTSRLEVIGENVILVKENLIVPSSGSLRCILSNDPELNNLSVRSYVMFCELATLATKAHIYNTNIVKIDEGVAHFGKNIGAFRQVIESYSDAEEMYIEMLRKKWQKIAFMNDRDSMSRFIRSQVSLNR